MPANFQLPVYAYFSGGKDSLAALLYAYDNDIDIRGVIYTEVTGNTHETNIEYAKDIVKQLGYRLIYLKAARAFYNDLVNWGIPFYKTRWCMTHYKVRVWRKFHRNIPHIALVGVKHSDSRVRKIYFQDNLHLNKNISQEYMWSPILSWSTKQVYAYIKKNSVKLNPLYKIIYDSGNCMFCPFKSIKQIKGVSNLPDWRLKIIDFLKQIRDINKITMQVKYRWLKYLENMKLEVIKEDAG